MTFMYLNNGKVNSISIKTQSKDMIMRSDEYLQRGITKENIHVYMAECGKYI